MNRYWWSVLALVLAAMATFSIATIVVFSGGLREQQEQSMQRMEAVAAYCVEHLDEDTTGGAAPREYGSIDSWLGNLCVSTGFERIVVADSLGLVHFSSHNLIFRGDDIAPYLIDKALFDRAAVSHRPQLTAPVRIHDTRFRSLYYPALRNGESLVIVVEADQQYFTAARQFRDAVAVTAAVLALMLAIVSGSVVAVGRRAAAAQQRARRNEELAFLGRASAELAHELKNPLAIVKSSADVLRRKFDPAGREKAFGFLSEEVMRLSRMVNDILSFSRQKQLFQEPFAPREALDTAAARLTAELGGLEIAISIPPGRRLVGDRDAFGRIVDNLMRNAAHAMHGTGRLAIREEIRGRRLGLCFSDSGPGIPRELAPRIFDPFVSGSKTGTGLGLAIVRSLCEASGWRIELESAAAGATCFCIYIPEGMWRKS